MRPDPPSSAPSAKGGQTHVSRAAPGARPSGVAAEDAPRYVRQLFDRIAPRYDRANHWLSLGVDVYWRWRTAAAVDRLLAAGRGPAVQFRTAGGPGPATDSRHRAGELRGATEGAPVIWDLCCGTGDLALALARRSARRRRGWRVYGADFTHRMLVLAGAKGRAGLPGAGGVAGWVEADGLRLPVRDGVATAVTTAFGFRNLADYRGALAEFARVLRPGGVLAILEFSAPAIPGLRAAYGWYFHRLLPRLGGWIAGSGEPYRYLPTSVDRFPAPRELATWMREAGFAEVRYRRLSGGIATLHTARRH
ncbi:MAG: ubiquinone/menaquinone biosynthesis methyltransferase [Terriglobales bacterium]